MEIITCNSTYKNEVCVGGYHEVHKINFISNTQHAIATVESVIKNNLLYGCNDTQLKKVIVYCHDEKLTLELSNYFLNCCIRVEVEHDYN